MGYSVNDAPRILRTPSETTQTGAAFARTVSLRRGSTTTSSTAPSQAAPKIAEMIDELVSIEPRRIFAGTCTRRSGDGGRRSNARYTFSLSLVAAGSRGERARDVRGRRDHDAEKIGKNRRGTTMGRQHRDRLRRHEFCAPERLAKIVASRARPLKAAAGR